MYPKFHNAFTINFKAYNISSKNFMCWSFLFFQAYHLPCSKILASFCSRPIPGQFFFYFLPLYILLAVSVMIFMRLTFGYHHACASRLMPLSLTHQPRMSWDFALYFKSFCMLVLIWSISCYTVNEIIFQHSWEFWGQWLSFLLSISEI